MELELTPKEKRYLQKKIKVLEKFGRSWIWVRWWLLILGSLYLLVAINSYFVLDEIKSIDWSGNTLKDNYSSPDRIEKYLDTRFELIKLEYEQRFNMLRTAIIGLLFLVPAHLFLNHHLKVAIIVKILKSFQLKN